MSLANLSLRRISTVLLTALLVTGGAQIAKAAAATDDAKGVIRIKAGASAAVTDEKGRKWLADQGFTGGDTIDRAADLAVANTDTPSLFRSEHYDMSGFTYKLPNGKYTVKLYFAETFEEINGTGQRVFSFSVGGRDFKDFDIWAKAGGGQRAYVETVPVEVKDGKLDITFTSKVQNSEINAIEIIPAS